MEQERQKIQRDVDSSKTRLERNRLGQFSTPIELATDIVRYALSLLAEEKISFLDPAIGTGAFYSALLQSCEIHRVEKALGYDIDPLYAQPAIHLWSRTGLAIHIKDFLRQAPPHKSNLVICNPPYVRHHHIEAGDKAMLQYDSFRETGIPSSGLSGLYSYFTLFAHKWMKPDGIGCWLIPSEFMDVNYGSALRNYLLNKVKLIHIHRFSPEDVQFSDALVSSAIVVFRNSPPSADDVALFSFGGSLVQPAAAKRIRIAQLQNEKKWSRFPLAEISRPSSTPTIGDFFNVKRGLATGSNNFFILHGEKIKEWGLPLSFFRPVLPGPRHLANLVIEADEQGYPLASDQIFLLDTEMPEEKIKQNYPALWKYLNEGKHAGISEGYICSHRIPWYSQEKRPPAPILCTYMGRSSANGKNPFRFILNRSQAVMTNVYLGLYPNNRLTRLAANDPDLLRRIWQTLNGISIENIVREGRVYGGGLYKLEPKELSKVPLPGVEELVAVNNYTQPQMEF